MILKDLFFFTYQNLIIYLGIYLFMYFFSDVRDKKKKRNERDMIIFELT